VRVCYSSVFGDSWMLESKQLSGASTWTPIAKCNSQPAGMDF
jgi:hypothetical protein